MNSWTQTDVYPQRLVGPTRGDFTPIFGEASVVYRPLVRMHDQPRQTVLIIFIPKKKSQNTLSIKINLFSIYILLHESYCVRQ